MLFVRFVSRCLLILAVAPAATGAGIDETGSVTPPSITLEQRVECARAIEAVRWEHRLWPEGNPVPKPPLSDVLSDERLRSRVRRTLLLSSALENVWGRPLSPSQLQREVDRLARDSRHPERLRELWAALDDDAFLVAECMGRPALTRRLARRWFSADREIHAEMRESAERDLYAAQEGGRLQGSRGAYDEFELRRPAESPDAFGAPSRLAGGFAGESWEASLAELIDQLGVEPGTALHAGLTGPLREESDRFLVTAVLETAPDSVRIARVTWPKLPLDEWLVRVSSRLDLQIELEPHTYRLPALEGSGMTARGAAAGCEADSWSQVRDTPSCCGQSFLNQISGELFLTFDAVWTGSEMILFGGNAEAGDRYDPATDRWSSTSVEGAPHGRRLHSAVWTGSEVIVWGGQHLSVGRFSTGGRYDPATDTWTPTSTGAGVPSARTRHSAVWTGTEMIVWGGFADGIGDENSGARYDPASDTWTPTAAAGAPTPRFGHRAVWTGTEMVVWGGAGDSSGGRYDPIADAWSPTSLANAPAGRSSFSALWTGAEMVVWGGCGSSCNGGRLNSGGRYDPATDAWSPTSLVGAPHARRGHSAVWTGDEMIVWGGCYQHNDLVLDCPTPADRGARYRPDTDTWSAMDTDPNPVPIVFQRAVWTGEEMIVMRPDVANGLGARYRPATDSWVPVYGFLDEPPGPAARHTAVWTGSEMILWGGSSFGRTGRNGDGYRYDPVTDDWTRTAFGPLGGRDYHSAVWTGSEMIVWGGSDMFESHNSGARYNPASDTWVPTSTAGAPAPRSQHGAVWTGQEMLVWGGINPGGRYDPSTDSWSGITEAGSPQGRSDFSTVWTGSEMIVWGGTGPLLNTGARYDPAADSWTPVGTTGAPAPRARHSAVWTGSEMIVWGGRDSDWIGLGDGGRYDPASDAWTPMTAAGAPVARTHHSASWTGSEMIVFGGCRQFVGCKDDVFAEGNASYDPAMDSWRPVSGFREPISRWHHTSVWAGDRMVVWGGEHDSSRIGGVARALTWGGAYCPGSAEAPGAVAALSATRNANGTDVDLAWGASCSAQATDYAVYEGAAGEFGSHQPNLCTTAGDTFATVTPAAGARYFLAVAMSPSLEGSYGTRSDGSQRPRSSSPCLAEQSIDTCP